MNKPLREDVTASTINACLRDLHYARMQLRMIDLPDFVSDVGHDCITRALDGLERVESELMNLPAIADVLEGR